MKKIVYQLIQTKPLLTALLVVMVGLTVNHRATAQELAIDFNKSTPEVVVADDNMHQLGLTFSYKGVNAFTVETKSGFFNEIAIPGTFTIGQLGTPKLPASKKLIEIPFGAEVSVTVKNFTVTEYKLSDFGIAHQIMPAQPSIRKDQDVSEIPFEFDQEIYQKDLFIEPELASIEVQGVMRGYRIARLTVAPVSYNPAKGIIRVCNDIELEISFTDVDEALTEYIKESTFSPYFKVVENSLLNTLGGGGYPNNPDLTKYPVKYLIVSDRMFEDDLQTFIEWKTMKGFEVIVAYTDEIGSSYSAIQTWIHDQYNQGTPSDPAPSFFLLVGDTPQIPAETGSATNRQTDLYYASVDGDYFPEMYYGRFSATNSTQLLTQIAKTIYYEKYEFTDPTYLNGATLIAGEDGTWNPAVGQPTVLYGTENYFNASYGFTDVYPFLSSYGGCYDPDKIAVSMINYTAHCNETVWGGPTLTQGDVNNFQNTGEYPIAIANCCMSGDFGYGECIGETWQRGVNKGSVAYIGSSPSSYWFEDFYWAVGAFPIQGNNNGYVPTYDETTWGAYDGPFVSDYVTTGATVFIGNLAVTEVDIQGYPQHSTPLYYWQAYNVLGDPSLVPYFTEGDQNTVSHMAILPIGVDFYLVEAEPGSYVGISKDGVLHGSALVDGSGSVEVPLEPILSSGDVDIVVTKPQYIPYMVQVPAAALVGPYVVLDSYTINDPTGNNNGLADYNEDITLNVTLKNVGADPSAEVIATVTGSDDYVTLTGTASQNFGIIIEGGTATVDDAYGFSIASSVPDQHQAQFTVEVTDGGETWTSNLVIICHAPILTFVNYSIDDSNGNNNGFLDPGETADMTVTVENSGSADAYNVVALLTSSDPMITVNTAGPQNVGDLIPEDQGQAVFSVYADPNIVPGYVGELNIGFTADLGIAQEDIILIPFADYCEASTNTEDEWIANVSCGDIDNSSGWQGLVADYTDITTTLEPGVGEPITIENGNAWSSDLVTVWVDWNLDKEFGNNANETFELANVGGSGQTFTGDITPPADQFPGQFRMRVRMTYSSAPEPCGESSYGEVEDYTVLVQGTLTASFNADVTEGCEELTVNYTDSSFGDIISWEWDFEGGDPATSTEQNPTVFYAVPGVYDVTLIVGDGTTTNTSFQSDYISVFELPEVTFAEIPDMCLNWPGYELTEGEPAGGEYTGIGVEDGWFYPEVAGIGTHELTYTYMDDNGCENFAGQTVYVDGCVGIVGTEIETALNIFPNPASTVLNINITGTLESVEYTLLNYQGREVYSKTIGRLNGFVSHQLELGEYAGGIYYLRLKTNDEVIIRKVMIR